MRWPEPPLEALTAREHEILTLLAGGLTNREIAQRLALSPRTVETHVARITGKLGVGSRARAVARAVTLGIVTHRPA
jgi:DNA-binding NarL/FixJ family response regulator